MWIPEQEEREHVYDEEDVNERAFIGKPKRSSGLMGDGLVFFHIYVVPQWKGITLLISRQVSLVPQAHVS